MPARVLHQGGAAIKTHGLAVEQGGQKLGGMMALEPAAGIGQQGKAVRMGFRKTVFGKAAYLANNGGGKLEAVCARQDTRQASTRLLRRKAEADVLCHSKRHLPEATMASGACPPHRCNRQRSIWRSHSDVHRYG